MSEALVGLSPGLRCVGRVGESRLRSGALFARQWLLSSKGATCGGLEPKARGLSAMGQCCTLCVVGGRLACYNERDANAG